MFRFLAAGAIAIGGFAALAFLPEPHARAGAHPQTEETYPVYEDQVSISQVMLLCGPDGPATPLIDADRPVTFTLIVNLEHHGHPIGRIERKARLGDAVAGCDLVPQEGGGDLRTDHLINEAYLQTQEGSRRQVYTHINRMAFIDPQFLGDPAPLYHHDEQHCAPLEEITANFAVIMEAGADPIGAGEQILSRVAGEAVPFGDLIVQQMAGRESFERLAGAASAEYGSGLTLEPGRNVIPLEVDGQFTGVIELQYEVEPENPRLECEHGYVEPEETPQNRICIEDYNRRTGHDLGEDADGSTRTVDLDGDGEREDYLLIACQGEQITPTSMCLESWRHANPGAAPASVGDERWHEADFDQDGETERRRVYLVDCGERREQSRAEPEDTVEGALGALAGAAISEALDEDEDEQPRQEGESQQQQQQDSEPESSILRGPGFLEEGEEEQQEEQRDDRGRDEVETEMRPLDLSGEDQPEPGPAWIQFEDGDYRATEDGCEWGRTVTVTVHRTGGTAQDDTDAVDTEMRQLELRDTAPIILEFPGTDPIELEPVDSRTAQGHWPGSPQTRVEMRLARTGGRLDLPPFTENPEGPNSFQLTGSGEDWSCTSRYVRD